MSGREIAAIRLALEARANAEALFRADGHPIAAVEQPVAPEFRRMLAQHYAIPIRRKPDQERQR